jgi:hypothetical protein
MFMAASVPAVGSFIAVPQSLVMKSIHTLSPSQFSKSHPGRIYIKRTQPSKSSTILFANSEEPSDDKNGPVNDPAPVAVAVGDGSNPLGGNNGAVDTISGTNTKQAITPAASPSDNVSGGNPEQLGIVLAPIVFGWFVYAGATGGLGVAKVETFSDWGGEAALYAAVATYIAGVMSYTMAVSNRKEDKKERKEERKEDKKDEWQRQEYFMMANEISRLYDRRLSAWWPSEKRAIDERLNATNTRLQALRKEFI